MSTRFVIASAVLAALAPPAHAGRLADALAKADAGTVAALRAERTDPVARCTLGAVYAKRRDLPRASIYLDGCADRELPDDIGPAIRAAARDVKKQLRDGDLSSVEILTRPDGLPVTITALPDEPLTTPVIVWVTAGTYEVQATTPQQLFKQTVSVGTRSRAMVLIETAATHGPTPTTKDGRVDFTEENATETQTQGPPPAVKHPSLLPDKYRRRTAAAAGPGLLDDPLAVRAAPRPPRATWLGLRLGAGMFDDATSDARIAGTVAATLRHALAPRLFLAARLDYSRRGGTTPDPIDTLGASAGVGTPLLTGAVGLAALAQLRGDLRFAAMDGVARVGASAALGLEATLPGTPFAAGIRFEHGLTAVVGDTRDRALLVEVGVDLR